MNDKKKINNYFDELRIKILNNPIIIVLFICLTLAALNIFLIQQNHSYDSDDVSWQTILSTWRPFSGEKAYVGSKDNFIVNLPFIVLANHLVGTGRTQLLIASMLMGLVNFVLFYIACIYFLKKANVKIGYASLSPFIWLASFGVGLISLFLNTVWRDYEIGVSFVYYALAAMYYFDEIKPFKRLHAKLLSLVALFISGCFVQSDPYFFYFTVLPIGVFFIVQYLLKNIPRKKLFVVLAWSFLSFFLAKSLTNIAARIGIIEPSGQLTFTGLSNLGSSFGQFMRGASYIFGISQGGIHWWSIPNLVLVIIVVYFLLKHLWSKQLLYKFKNSPRDMWTLFFAAIIILVSAAYITLDEGGIYNYRYLLLTVYISVLLLAFTTSLLKSWLRSLVIGILLAAALSNTIYTYSSYRLAAQTTSLPNLANLQLITTIRKLGLSKGYAGYWDGNINTYLSQNIDFLPIDCMNRETRPLNFLVNEALFNKPASTTFIIIDPGMNPPTCSQKQIINQFGQPDKEVKVSNDLILVYNYDLISKMRL